MSALSFRARHRYRSGFQLEAAFELEEGVAALVGPSGSGKTTLLSVIAGVIRPDEGFVRLGDHTLLDTHHGIHVPPEQRQVGFVFQDQLLFPHLSVRGNLLYGQRRRPFRAVDLGRVVEVLDLKELLSRSPATLSGGEGQRVALGRAILRGPELLLLDEPLTGLDEPLKARILEYLERTFAEWKIPTLFVSHDPTQVERLAGTRLSLSGGKLAQGATPPGQ